MATITCPHCSNSLELPGDLSGKFFTCAKCGKTFDLASAAMKSGEPPAKPPTATAVTEAAPTPKASPSPDLAMPRERRDIEKRSSAMVPIIIVGAVLLAGVCICGGPVMLFLGGVSMFHMERQEVAIAAERHAAQEAVAAMDEMKVVVEKQAPGFAKGSQDAKDAIAKGTLLMKEYPPIPAPGWHGDYIKLLKEKCNCDYQVVNGKLDKREEDELRGWNDAMQAQLRGRHGPTITEDLHKEAEARWRERIGGGAGGGGGKKTKIRIPK